MVPAMSLAGRFVHKSIHSLCITTPKTKKAPCLGGLEKSSASSDNMIAERGGVDNLE